MKNLAAFMIRFYQRFLSPYKGFRCAYGVYHGGSSCSGEIMHIVESYPLREWWPRSQGQFQKCKHAFLKLKETNATSHFLLTRRYCDEYGIHEDVDGTYYDQTNFLDRIGNTVCCLCCSDAHEVTCLGTDLACDGTSVVCNCIDSCG